MIPAIPFLAAAAVASLAPFFPSPVDAHGWGLRVHGLTIRGPYLVGEAIDRIHLKVTLLNVSKETRMHEPLIVARDTGDLELVIVQPDGEWLAGDGGAGPRNPFTQQLKLLPGAVSSEDFRFAEFGYGRLRMPGQHQLKAVLRINGKKITAPPVVVEVVEVPANAVLVNHTVPLEGREAALPADERYRPFVQQVKVGKRTLLIYRLDYGPKWGGGIDRIYRLAELPGKVEMAVEGAYGDGKPLTITYKDPNSKTGTTTLKINSIDGMPWTDEEERLLQQRLKGDSGSSRVTPPPRPIKP